MKYGLEITLSAFYDLEDAIGYYEMRVKGLGKRMETDFWKSIDLIRSTPLGYRIYHKQLRQKMLEKFPYGIIYEVLNDNIVVFKVSHLKTKPNKRYTI